MIGNLDVDEQANALQLESKEAGKGGGRVLLQGPVMGF